MLKSIQFKQMCGMIAVTAVSIIVVDVTYQTWLAEAGKQALISRVERAVLSFEPHSVDPKKMRNELVALARRFDLAGICLIDNEKQEILVRIGLPDTNRVMAMASSKHIDGMLLTREVRNGNSGKEIWGWRYFRFDEGTEFTLMAAAAVESEIFATEAISSLSRMTLVGSVLVVALISYLLRGMFVRPVQVLSHAITRVAQGDLSHKVDTNVDKELVELVTSFNSMIDELKQSRSQVEDYQNTLEQRIEAAKEELAVKDAELLQAEKLASIGQLAAGVAHEINNPLHYIMLTAGLVREDVEDDGTRGRVEKIIEQARRCQKIVSDLLEYSRRGAATRGKVNLNDALEKAIKQLAEEKLFSGIDIEVRLAETMPQFSGSQEEVQRVLENILRNSSQAMEAAGSIEAFTEYDDQRQVMKAVISDSGPGMSPEICSRAFEPFFSTKAVNDGTGLGLSIAYGMVARHGGKINLSSEPGRGTRIEVSFPTDAARSSRRLARKETN